MGFLDSLLGRSKPAAANLDVLFSVPQAALSLQAAGFTATGQGALCFRDAEGGADDAVMADVEKVILTDPGATVTRTDDSYGFSWLSVTRTDADVTGLVTDLHAANSSMEAAGFGTALLCSTVAFRAPEGGSLALVYLYKRGTVYPFAPAGETRRDNALELQVRGIVGADVPVEQDLQRWLAIWGAPGL